MEAIKWIFSRIWAIVVLLFFMVVAMPAVLIANDNFNVLNIIGAIYALSWYLFLKTRHGRRLLAYIDKQLGLIFKSSGNQLIENSNKHESKRF